MDMAMDMSIFNGQITKNKSFESVKLNKILEYWILKVDVVEARATIGTIALVYY